MFIELSLDVKVTRTIDKTLSPNERVNRVLNKFCNNIGVIVVFNQVNIDRAEAT